MQIQLQGYTEKGNRMENEDSGTYGRLGEDGFFAVAADGLGGHGGGKRASETAVRVFDRGCQEQGALPGREEVLAWFDQANRQILSERDREDHMKTTVVFLAVSENRALWAHIGDYRLYHYFDGGLADATEDHSVCQVAVKLGEITRRQIPGHPDRNRLLRVLGDEEPEPEIEGPVPLSPGRHAFLLCTDGLWERLQEDEILLELCKADSPGRWLENLRWRAEKRKCRDVDNHTAVAAFVDVSTNF